MGNTYTTAITTAYNQGIQAVVSFVYPASNPTGTILAGPVPGAVGPDTLDLSICALTNTEVNHDLLPAVSSNTHKTEPAYQIIRRNIGQCHGSLPPEVAGQSEKVRFNFYNDEGIVKAIMGLTKSEVLHIPPNTSFALDILQHNPGDALTSSIIKRVRIKVCIPVTGKEYNSDDLLGLFEGKDNVFFIIDVGDHFVEKLRKITCGTANRLKIHVVHSAVTQADSASKTKPNAKVYTDTDNTKCVRVFSWWYNQPINVNGADARAFFLSRYDILTQPANVAAVGAATAAPGAAGAAASGNSWKMSQRWTDSTNGNHVYETLDAHIDNSKPKVITYLNTNLATALGATTTTPTNKQNCSLEMQKKRSGDWLQIWMAHKLPEFLSNLANFKGMNTISRGVGPVAAVSATDIPGYNIDQYRQCTYFITGDWPAACYALYRNVNVILVINGSTKNKITPAIICINCN